MRGVGREGGSGPTTNVMPIPFEKQYLKDPVIPVQGASAIGASVNKRCATGHACVVEAPQLDWAHQHNGTHESLGNLRIS